MIAIDGVRRFPIEQAELAVDLPDGVIGAAEALRADVALFGLDDLELGLPLPSEICLK